MTHLRTFPAKLAKIFQGMTLRANFVERNHISTTFAQ